jgi:4-hydroxy-2-oxoheptanedioate aldolase
MPVPANPFKQALHERKTQIGLWLALANAYTAEIAAQAGFDWLVIDGEHAPNDTRSILSQLQAIASSRSHAVVRLPADETWMIKQALDIGAQTLLVPMVESVDQARRIVSATRYAPAGTRGIGAALARASHFNAIGDYIATAADELCVIVQVETRAGVAAIEALAAVDGIDGIFVGPSDLAADMGYPGNSGHPEVRRAVIEALRRIRDLGKPSGILSSDPAMLEQCFDLGVTFIAVGSDIGVFTAGLSALRRKYDGTAKG